MVVTKYPLDNRAQILPVPTEMFPKLWPYARPWLKRIPGFDMTECRNRLLLGEDMLWMICSRDQLLTNHHPRTHPYVGAILTSVFRKPPYPPKQKHMNDWFKRVRSRR